MSPNTMTRKSNNTVRNTLMIVAGVLGMLVLFSIVLRIALAPLYQEVAQMQHEGGESYSGDRAGGEGYGSNININLGGLGGWLNWALGWAWGGPGWYGGRPGGGWWGSNWWNGSWGRNGNNEFNNDTFNRTVDRDANVDRIDRNEFRGDRDELRGGEEHFHGGGGGGFHGGGRR